MAATGDDHQAVPRLDHTAIMSDLPGAGDGPVVIRPTFDAAISAAGAGGLRGSSIDTVQVNIGLGCNLACLHCHVESSPHRAETMEWETMEQVLDAADRAGAPLLDITGGAPEMNPRFRRFVDAARARGLRVMVRTNLTIMLERGYEDLPAWFAARQVHLIASLPCYLESNVDRQRGRHVYQGSITAIQRLNEAGYGLEPALPLDLVYNPLGATLPPSERELGETYRSELHARFGIRFTRLITITNMAIGRFLADLRRQGRAEAYADLLREAFNPATLDGLMCRSQLHVGWDGRLFDCDFNFAIDLPAAAPSHHVVDFDPVAWRARRIATSEHCFGCTAGNGSSCGGALV